MMDRYHVLGLPPKAGLLGEYCKYSDVEKLQQFADKIGRGELRGAEARRVYMQMELGNLEKQQ